MSKSKVFKEASKGSGLRYAVEWRRADGSTFEDSYGASFTSIIHARNHIRACQRESRRLAGRIVAVLGSSGRPSARGEWLEPLPLEIAHDRSKW